MTGKVAMKMNNRLILSMMTLIASAILLSPAHLSAWPSLADLSNKFNAGLDTSLTAYKKPAQEFEFVLEARTLVLLGLAGLTVSGVSAYQSMKQGFESDNFEKQKADLSGHEEMLQIVRTKIVDLLTINPENKAGFEELIAEEALLLQEIKQIKETHKKCSFREMIESKAFKHISLKDAGRGVAAFFGTAIGAELVFKGAQAVLRAQGKGVDADDLWNTFYKGQEDVYRDIAAATVLMASIAKRLVSAGALLFIEHQPEIISNRIKALFEDPVPLSAEASKQLEELYTEQRRGIVLSLLASTLYTFKTAKDRIQARKIEQVEKFSYVDDILLSPLQVMKEVGASGAAQWAGMSYVGMHAFCKLFEIDKLRATINPPDPAAP